MIFSRRYLDTVPENRIRCQLTRKLDACFRDSVTWCSLWYSSLVCRVFFKSRRRVRTTQVRELLETDKKQDEQTQLRKSTKTWRISVAQSGLNLRMVSYNWI